MLTTYAIKSTFIGIQSNRINTIFGLYIWKRNIRSNQIFIVIYFVNAIVFTHISMVKKEPIYSL